MIEIVGYMLIGGSVGWLIYHFSHEKEEGGSEDDMLNAEDGGEKEKKRREHFDNAWHDYHKRREEINADYEAKHPK
jgi:fatty acid desaturase